MTFTSIRSRLGVALLALFAALTAAVVAPSPASAYSFEYDYAVSTHWSNGKYWCVHNGGVPSAIGCFEQRGDYLEPGDAAADGQSVGIQWKTDYGRSGVCVSTGGKDSSYDYAFVQGDRQCNKNFEENRTITYRTGRCNFSTTNCGSLANWNSWSGWLSRET